MAECDRLDDYLCGWLDPAEAAQFADHVAGCDACRAAMELQRRIDRHLAEYRESVEIPESIAGLRVDARRNRVSAQTALAVLAATAVILVIGIGLYLSQVSGDKSPDVAAPLATEIPTSESPVPLEQNALPDEDVAPAVPLAAVEPGPGSIAVQVPSRSSRVSVFQVYSIMQNSPDPQD